MSGSLGQRRRGLEAAGPILQSGAGDSALRRFSLSLRLRRSLPRGRGVATFPPPPASSCDWGRAKPFGEAEATENPAAVVSPAVGEMHWGWACMVVLVMMVCGQTLRVCSPKAAAFCGLVLVFGSKLVSCDAAGLPFGMVSEPRRRLEPTLAGSLVE